MSHISRNRIRALLYGTGELHSTRKGTQEPKCMKQVEQFAKESAPMMGKCLRYSLGLYLLLDLNDQFNGLQCRSTHGYCAE